MERYREKVALLKISDHYSTASNRSETIEFGHAAAFLSHGVCSGH